MAKRSGPIYLRKWRTGYEIEHSIAFATELKDWRFGRSAKSSLSCDYVCWGFGPLLYMKMNWVPY